MLFLYVALFLVAVIVTWACQAHKRKHQAMMPPPIPPQGANLTEEVMMPPHPG